MPTAPLFAGRLVVERKRWFPPESDAAARQRRLSGLGSDLEDSIAKYRGPDASLFREEVLSKAGLSQELGLLASQVSSIEIIDRLGTTASSSPLDIIECVFFPEDATALEEWQTRGDFLGFDYVLWGFGEWAYSIVFHEVLFGQHRPLAELAPRLNAHLLLPDESTLTELRRRRQRLESEGADLETAEDREDGPYVVAVLDVTEGARASVS